MKRIYIAGPYSSENVVGVLDNIRDGMRVGTKVLLAGFAPFVPWFDFHFQLMLREGENLSVQDYYDYSIAWLLASDAMLVHRLSKNSVGTIREIEIAEQNLIPVYYSLAGLIQFEGKK